MSISSLSLLAAVLVVISQMDFISAFPSTTVPAFLWSRNLEGPKEIVDYRVLSPTDLAKTVMTEAGWLDLLCPVEKALLPHKFAFIFVGKELNSMDITGGPSKADPVLVELLQDSFSNSNSSVAFPYLTAAASEDDEHVENSLLLGFADSCQHRLRKSRVTLVGSCIAQGEEYHRLTSIDSLSDYLNEIPDEGADLIVLCSGVSSSDDDRSDAESTILSRLLDSVKPLVGVEYSVLYVSDPFRAPQYVNPHRELKRFLAEGTTAGNASSNSTVCDNVCQIKSSLLEGLFVGIVLLIILISGLCCMMGIDTPSRFETPQET